MLYMAVTLSTVSILTRVLIMFVSFYFSTGFSQYLNVLLLTSLVYTFVPTMAIFVFYFFNRMFYDEINEKVFSRLCHKSNENLGSHVNNSKNAMRVKEQTNLWEKKHWLSFFIFTILNLYFFFRFEVRGAYLKFFQKYLLLTEKNLNICF
jgi:hypothetical protein